MSAAELIAKELHDQWLKGATDFADSLEAGLIEVSKDTGIKDLDVDTVIYIIRKAKAGIIT